MTKSKTQALLTGVAPGLITTTDHSTAGPSLQDSGLPQINNTAWIGYCVFASYLRRRKELAKFLDELRAGRRHGVTDPELFAAAAALVVALREAGLRLTPQCSPPSAEELGSPTWVAERVAAERASQAAAGHDKRWQQGLARALGEPRPAGTGTINPVHLQELKHSLEDLGRRLRKAMDRPGFQREWLDHRSPQYIPDRDGGISNKQVTIMAGLISGRQERPFDESWTIVTNWLREQHMEQPRPDQAA